MIPALKQVESTLRGGEFQFRCTACGLCCEGTGDVYFSRSELAKIARFIKKNKRNWKELKGRLIQGERNGLAVHSAGDACLFLENGKCSIYALRPLQCRTFPFWPSHFRSQKALKDLQRTCPGSASGVGPALNAEKVHRRIKRTHQTFQKEQDKKAVPVTL